MEHNQTKHPAELAAAPWLAAQPWLGELPAFAAMLAAASRTPRRRRLSLPAFQKRLGLP